MPRPALRPMRALPVLEPRRDALEKCVFCPKLCRSACPVSNAEPRETITPWGKMSMAWTSPRTATCPSNARTRARLGVHRLLRVPRVVRPPERRRRRAARRRATRFAGAASRPPAARARARALRRARRATRAGACASSRAHPARATPMRATRSSSAAATLRAAPREARDAIDAATRARRRAGRARRGVLRAAAAPRRRRGAASRGRRASSRASLDAPRARLLVVDAGLRAGAPRRYPEVGRRRSRRRSSCSSSARRAQLERLRAASADGAATSPFAGTTPVSSGAASASTRRRARCSTRALGRAPDEFDDRREQAVLLGRRRAPAVDDARDVARDIADDAPARRTRARAAGASSPRARRACWRCGARAGSGSPSTTSSPGSRARAPGHARLRRDAGPSPGRASSASTVARRVLASFAITVVAFAVTLGWGIVAQRRAADDSVELARGYVPVAPASSGSFAPRRPRCRRSSTASPTSASPARRASCSRRWPARGGRCSSRRAPR